MRWRSWRRGCGRNTWRGEGPVSTAPQAGPLKLRRPVTGGWWNLERSCIGFPRYAQDHRGREVDGVQGPADGPSGVPGQWHASAALLLSPGVVDRRFLPDLPCRSRGTAEAGAFVPDAGAGWDGGAHQLTQGDREPEAGDGIPAGESPAGLPGVRPGGGMRTSGLQLRVWAER